MDPTGELIGIDDVILVVAVGAIIGGSLNVVANYNNINGFGSLASYFGVGAFAGGVGAGLSMASFGVGGVIGGALTGLLSGSASGFLLGGGNSYLNNGDFSHFWGDAFHDALVGGISGAVAGGIAGGYSAYKDGKNIWTGEQQMLDIPIQEIDPMPIQNVELETTRIDNTETLEAIRNKASDVTWELYYKEQEYNVFTDGNIRNFSRPKRISYAERLATQTDLHHSFPQEMDPIIVQNGNSLSIGNSSSYILSGRFGDKYGYFQININDKGVIYHRAFYEFAKRHQIYVNCGEKKVYFFR